MADTPVLEVERCEKTEASLWVAILSVGFIMIVHTRSTKGKREEAVQ